jgi:ACR3 family arsenite efflux pump ArsB
MLATRSLSQAIHHRHWAPSLSSLARHSQPSAVLVEVPVLLSVVRIVRASRGWYEQR